MPPLEVLPQQPQSHWAPHWAAEVRLARQVRLAEVVLLRWPPVAVARQPARAQGPRQVPAHRPLLVEAQVPPLDWPGRQTQARCPNLQQAEAVRKKELVQAHLRASAQEMVPQRGLLPGPQQVQERVLPPGPPREQERGLLVTAQLLALPAQQ